MKLFPLLVLSVTFLNYAKAVENSFQAEFYAAAKLKDSDPEAAIAGMKRSFKMAVAAGNADYATSAGLNACYLLYNQGKSVESGRLAREVILALDPLEDKSRDGDPERRTQLFGLLERGLRMEGKLGAAWQANRAAAETLRGRKLSADGDGNSIAVAEIKGLPPALRPLGWRLVERESELLDFSGRSVDAGKLLTKGASALGDDWQQLPEIEAYYAFKLLAEHCMLLDYLGYDHEAIEAQQKLLAASESTPLTRQINHARLLLEFNLLRNRSQWEGPSEKILGDARKIVTRLKGMDDRAAVDRLLAKMELDLRESQAALETLRDSARKEADLGNFLEKTYADRDSLVARAKSGEAGLDSEFIRLLTEMRAQGNKRGEPQIYVEYADYLLSTDHAAEAISMYQEALRLKRSFGLILHEPKLLLSLFQARMAAGDLEGAKSTLRELESFITSHGHELPPALRVLAETARAIALGKLGESAAAKAALELARSFAGDLPEFKKLLLAPDQEDGIIHPPQPKPVAPAASFLPLHIQPLEVASVAVPMGNARTHFVVSNPAEAGVKGEWHVKGPGAILTQPGSVHFTAGKPTADLSLSTTVQSGGTASLIFDLTGSADITAADVQVSWQTSMGKDSAASVWTVQWNADASNRVVMDASLLEANPFHSISLFHELAVPLGLDTAIPLRLRSPIPLRLEYYEADSGELLAVDANGNGDFTEAGDCHGRSVAGADAALVPVKPGSSRLSVEIRIFAPSGEPLVLTPAVILETEIYRGKEWIKEAESVLK